MKFINHLLKFFNLKVVYTSKTLNCYGKEYTLPFSVGQNATVIDRNGKIIMYCINEEDARLVAASLNESTL